MRGGSPSSRSAITNGRRTERAFRRASRTVWLDHGAGCALEADGNVHQAAEMPILTQMVSQNAQPSRCVRRFDSDVLSQTTGTEDRGMLCGQPALEA